MHPKRAKLQCECASIPSDSAGPGTLLDWANSTLKASTQLEEEATAHIDSIPFKQVRRFNQEEIKQFESHFFDEASCYCQIYKWAAVFANRSRMDLFLSYVLSVGIELSPIISPPLFVLILAAKVNPEPSLSSLYEYDSNDDTWKSTTVWAAALTLETQIPPWGTFKWIVRKYHTMSETQTKQLCAQFSYIKNIQTFFK